MIFIFPLLFILRSTCILSFFRQYPDYYVEIKNPLSLYNIKAKIKVYYSNFSMDIQIPIFDWFFFSAESLQVYGRFSQWFWSGFQQCSTVQYRRKQDSSWRSQIAEVYAHQKRRISKTSRTGELHTAFLCSIFSRLDYQHISFDFMELITFWHLFYSIILL